MLGWLVGRGVVLSNANKELKGLQDAPTRRHSTRAGLAHLDAIQQLAHAPKAVSFNASQHVLR